VSWRHFLRVTHHALHHVRTPIGRCLAGAGEELSKSEQKRRAKQAQKEAEKAAKEAEKAAKAASQPAKPAAAKKENEDDLDPRQYVHRL
jgi:hypothetical protein